MRLTRRTILAASAACAGLLGGQSYAMRSIEPPQEPASAGPDATSLFADYAARAEAISQAPYVAPEKDLPAPFDKLDYDGYRRLRPKSEAAIWGEDQTRLAILPLPRGWLFPEPIALSIADAYGAQTIKSGAPFVDFIDYPEAGATARDALGISGWRLLKRKTGGYDEYTVFQGGCYFRAVAAFLNYGISARALALFTASNRPEEFPRFTDFCILKPAPDDTHVTAIALLDSPSITGVYQFIIEPGAETQMDIRAALFPRTALSEIGVAAMSSMFARGGADSDLILPRDARPEIHDSDGLIIDNAEGERLWRPLTNPRNVQISGFDTPNPRGFGLIQRQRALEYYHDDEARYHNRPSLWVTPNGDWGQGQIILTELPTANEYNDNIVAFWRPAAPWAPGQRYDLDYRLTWNANGPPADHRARIGQTRLTRRPTYSHIEIDFLVSPETQLSSLKFTLSADHGALRDQMLMQPTPDLVRLSFSLTPASHAPVELRATLQDAQTRLISETWAYRWTPRF